ncbi:RAD52 family DNA repair protein [Paracoccus angustae]|uniref:RAD52 family DNA repair protein n=1 Tax=Paracoccus angustae TaxID=1671480 RepID=A0ABV7TZQ7_9RHOB
MDWQKASVELAKKLDPSAVRQRSQSGQSLSYVEGWFVIAEANRIFGFEGWTRETLDIRCVAERERKIGKAPNQRDGWTVTYTARVRVTVDGVVRDGVGAGHGIGTDLGECHESAIKESETDAMKRALMTFGNPLGLALYDKARENVGVNVDDSAVTEAVDCFAKADTLDAANAIWRDLPADLKADARVIDAAKAAKARNKPQVAA